MLPASKPGAVRLADVLLSAQHAMRGERNRLDLPRVRSALVVLIDGLGQANLRARSGHARTLAAAPTRAIASGFPSTTASALASLTTGALPGEHGVVGYAALVPRHGVRNQLRDWGPAMDPATWQRLPTVFERSSSVVVNEPKFRSSGFTAATLRGASYLGASTADERVAAAVDALTSPEPTLAYCYVPELDRAGHRYGWESAEWTDALEQADRSIGELAARLPRDVGMLVTADHGMVDVPHDRHIILEPQWLGGAAHVGGEPRCLQLYRGPDDDAWEMTTAALRDELAGVAWVASRDEAIASGWFGEVHPDVLGRIGDLFVAARSRVAFYRDEGDDARGMIGQHGSLTPEELRVPIARFGAFA